MSNKKYFLKDFQEGMAVVFKHLFKPVVTMEYPDEKWKPFARFRGAPALYKDKCAVCCMCTNVCPSHAITIVGKENEKGAKEIESFELNISRCIFCGLCAEFCPRDAIILTHKYELSVFNKKELIYDVDYLNNSAISFVCDAEKNGIIEKIKK